MVDVVEVVVDDGSGRRSVADGCCQWGSRGGEDGRVGDGGAAAVVRCWLSGWSYGGKLASVDMARGRCSCGRARRCRVELVCSVRGGVREENNLRCSRGERRRRQARPVGGGEADRGRRRRGRRWRWQGRRWGVHAAEEAVGYWRPVVAMVMVAGLGGDGADEVVARRWPRCCREAMAELRGWRWSRSGQAVVGASVAVTGGLPSSGDARGGGRREQVAWW